MRNILIVARKEIQESLAEPLGPGDNAAARGTRAYPYLPRQRADRQRRCPRPRRRDREPVQPHDLPVPLIALLISHDAIVGEMERGTMLLLLSYPVGTLAGAARQVRRTRRDPCVRDTNRLRRGRRRTRHDRGGDRR